MKNFILLFYLSSLCHFHLLLGQTQTNNIIAHLSDLGSGMVEVIFTPQTVLSGVGNPLNIYLKIPDSQFPGTTININSNPFSLSFINDFSSNSFHYYFYQSQPSVNLANWPNGSPISIATFTIAGTATDITLSGGDFAVIDNGGSFFWPGTSIATNNTQTNLVSWPVNSNVSLPIELIRFEAYPLENNDILLTWETATEINSSHFEVEKSFNGGNWNYIGKVSANGWSYEKLHYNYIDKYSSSTFNSDYNLFYYRLKMLDNDGQFEYSPIRSARIEGNANIRVFPNPADTELNVEMFAEKEGEATMKIWNNAGHIVHEQSQELSEGNNPFSIEIAHWPEGVYFIQIRTGDGTLSEKFLKTN